MRTATARTPSCERARGRASEGSDGRKPLAGDGLPEAAAWDGTCGAVAARLLLDIVDEYGIEPLDAASFAISTTGTPLPTSRPYLTLLSRPSAIRARRTRPPLRPTPRSPPLPPSPRPPASRSMSARQGPGWSSAARWEPRPSSCQRIVQQSPSRAEGREPTWLRAPRWSCSARLPGFCNRIRLLAREEERG
ncbi:hypothetical protein DFJ74DRAFT_489433 [Hyaloraphidium curvatum]|nr:hypothetical protein DFJ74DRAFT_489433 [Hyaloraphidium curvatum]